MEYETMAEPFNPPDLRRSTYFPAWTITIPPNSDEGIFRQRVDDIRRKYIPLLIMAESGEYDTVWAEYTAELDALGQDKFERDLEFFQAEIDRRVEQRGGY
jgi:putative aldouronate transport system substrate-binding protein